MGWRGYFTEHDDFEDTIIMMMCWGNHYRISTLNRLNIHSAKSAFDYTSDGFISNEKQVQFSRTDFIRNANNFHENDMVNILKFWKENRTFRAKLFGTNHRYNNYTSTLDSDILLDYFHACGGKDYFLELIEKRFPEAYHVLCRRAKALTIEVNELSCAPNKTSTLGNLWRDFLIILGIPTAYKVIINENIEKFCADVRMKEPSELGEKVINLTHEIIDFRIKQLEIYSAPDAELDLKIWRANEIASVEVKAPNDRLRPNQILQLTKNTKLGHRSWVINVTEQ